MNKNKLAQLRNMITKKQLGTVNLRITMQDMQGQKEVISHGKWCSTGEAMEFADHHFNEPNRMVRKIELTFNIEA